MMPTMLVVLKAEVLVVVIARGAKSSLGGGSMLFLRGYCISDMPQVIFIHEWIKTVSETM